MIRVERLWFPMVLLGALAATSAALWPMVRSSRREATRAGIT